MGATLAVMGTTPAATFLLAMREALIATAVAALGAVGAVGYGVDKDPDIDPARFGYAVLGLSLLSTFALVYRLGAGLHGLGLEIFDQNWELSIVQNVPADKLARVFSFDVVGSFVARPLGLALTGPIATAVGYDTWLIVVGAVMGGSSLLAVSSSDVRRLRRIG